MKKQFTRAAMVAAFAPVTVFAQTDLNISAVLDGYYQNEHIEGGLRSEGFNIGHNELVLSAPVDDNFYGKLTTIIASHEGDIELEVEEAFIQTTALPYGIGVRGGRFLSDIGYLNNQHLHSDTFAERPVVYRNLLGSHYYDDGIRVNWVAPTPFYVNVFTEAMSGSNLEADMGHEEHDDGHDDEHGHDTNISVYTVGLELGGDIGTDHSWQFGVSALNNELGVQHLEPPVPGAIPPVHDHDTEHDHAHGAAFGAERMYIVDATYKWAPNGNYKYQSLTLAAEYINGSDAYEEFTAPGDNTGWYVSAAYRFSGTWSVGAMYSEFDGYEFHEFDMDPSGQFEAEYDNVTVKETQLALTWHPSHFSNIRLYATRQQLTMDEQETTNVVGISFNTALGDHGAHAF
ncbi:MAG: hypothetical protein HWD83_04715 [Gammaproteobacteria bacterium]|nr:hypothetical protein [Gammaproteobacteria bacterium]